MSEQEKFLDRWSRRKREAADERAPAESKDSVAGPSPVVTEAKDVTADVPFDPASLPPIESIVADSDIRAFLKPGVPAELTRAALRRAWSADPQIRDFIGLVENGWNFNDPVGVPGFGPMPVGEDIARLLAQAVGAPLPVPEQTDAPTQGNATQNSPLTDTAKALAQDQLRPEQGPAAAKSDPVQRSENDAALQNNPLHGEDVPAPRPHGKGGALPK